MRKAALLLIFLFALMPPAQASCGVGACTVNTGQETQALEEGLQTRVEIRYENYTQDVPRQGTRPVAVGEVPRHHDEVTTRNQNWYVNTDVAVDKNWGFTILVPVVGERFHEHIHNHHGEKLTEQWDFAALGDIRLLGRWQSTLDPVSRSFYGFKAGFKLPTGTTDEANADGDVAERSLQPGSGSLDSVVSAYYNEALGTRGSWFVSGTWQQPLTSRDQYRPGSRVELDLGYGHQLTKTLRGHLQLNLQVVGADAGANAEPDSSGGTYLFASPGLSWRFADQWRAYGFVQLPLYQWVNDVQLTRSYGVTAGVIWQP